MFSYLEDRYNDGERYVLHYVTAREVHNHIKAAEAGHGGDPNDYRDFIPPPPPLRLAGQRIRPCAQTPRDAGQWGTTPFTRRKVTLPRDRMRQVGDKRLCLG